MAPMNPLVLIGLALGKHTGRARRLVPVLSLCFLGASCLEASTASDPFRPARQIKATVYNSGFPEAHDTYNGMGCASDGRIFYVLSSEKHDVAARMYCFDPKKRTTAFVGDLNAACGEDSAKAIAQGKSHVNFVESNGKLFFATHIGFYSIVDGKETMGIPPAGFKPYQGGHLLSYDLKTGKFERYGIAPEREGILTFNMDPKRGRMFGLTWPSGIFFRYDEDKGGIKSFGKVAAEGENGVGPTYRTVCRSIAVNPQDGAAYFTTSEGTIMRWDPSRDSIEPVPGEDMKKDYFGLYDPTNPGHMGYNWRQTAWHPAEKAIYGVHGNSGYLFRFDPASRRMQVLDRITSEPSRASGMFDQFSYGYLGFAMGPDGRTIYYLTGGPIYENGRRVAGKASTAMGEAKGVENLHLITYDTRKHVVEDHGAVFYPNGQRPLYVNSIAVGLDGTVYSLGRVTENGRTRTDLFSVKP